MSEMNYFKKHYEEPFKLCFRCGSFDIKLLNEEDGKQVFKCGRCGKVWLREKKKECDVREEMETC